jgi:hypothetical protein
MLLLLILPLSVKSQQRGLRPDFVTLQYAGSIGYVSAGTGYDIFKGKSRISGHYGVVPTSKGGPLNILTAKIFFKPKVFRVKNHITINPLDIGLMVSYHFGRNFESRWPDELTPKGYYWWPTALRAHLATETSVTYRFQEKQWLHALTGYIEFNTNELYLVSYIQNTGALQLSDIIKVGGGLRITF